MTLAAIAAIISGCREVDNSGIRGYWSSRTLDLSDVDAAEDEFAQFAELAVQAPEKDAFAAIDMLLDKASKDEVVYLVYADWIARGFATLASPCHSCELFLHAADKMLKDKKFVGYSREEYLKLREFCLHNRVGDKAEIPLLEDREGKQFSFPLVQRTLFLVVDQDCPTCAESMNRFTTFEPDNTWLVALCYGHGELPIEPQWDCYRLVPGQEIFDTHEGPFYFVTSADGTIEITYTSVYDKSQL